MSIRRRRGPVAPPRLRCTAPARPVRTPGALDLDSLVPWIDGDLRSLHEEAGATPIALFHLMI